MVVHSSSDQTLERIREILPEVTNRDVIVFDGVCNLCNGFVQFVLKRDRLERFDFLTAQSDRGDTLYRLLELKSDDYETYIAIVDGRPYQRLDAFCIVMRELGWPWKALSVLGLMPQPLKDWSYGVIARNRYGIFGRRDTCMVPAPHLKQRFLD
ncbi:MAG: DCC1-like thiol-disulfide oxidoreductase family protein [Pseudomonadota bacterium]